MSPEMFGRMDDLQFQAGAETLLNMVPRPTGSAARRSGTKLVRQTRSSGASHLYPFVFSQSDSLVVEAGRDTIGGLDSGYFRFHSKGGTLLYSGLDAFYKSVIFSPIDLVQVECVNGLVGQFTLASHGLSVGDIVQIQATSIPICSPAITNGQTLIVNTVVDSNTITLKQTAASGGSALSISEKGFEVGLRGANLTRGNGNYSGTNYRVLWSAYSANDYGHALKPGDEVFMTMEPWSTSNVGFDGSHFKLLPQVGTNNTPSTGGLSKNPSYLGQQVIFFGDELPSGIVAGKPYYVIKNDDTHGGDPIFSISEVRGGAAHDSGATGYVGSTASGGKTCCAMPQAYRGYPSSGDMNHFDVLKSYWVANLTNSTGPAGAGSGIPAVGRFRLATSPGEVEWLAGNVVQYVAGFGEMRIHKVADQGDLVSYRGKQYYCRKELANRSGNLRKLDHDQSATRVPITRTADKAEYWRELPGKSTGAAFTATITRTGGGLLLVNATDHGLADGQAVTMSQGYAGVGWSSLAITFGTTYYVAAKTDDTFELEASAVGGTHVALSTSFSTGGVQFQAGPAFNTTTDKVQWPSHGLSDSDPVVFSKPAKTSQGAITSVLPGGLSHDTTYYVVNKTTDDFQVSATPYGDVIGLTGSPNSWHVASGGTYFEVPHDYTEAELPEISTTQSNDVLTLCSTLRPATELRRYSSTNWKSGDIEFKAVAKAPTDLQEVEIDQGLHTKVYGVRTVPSGAGVAPPNFTIELGTTTGPLLELCFTNDAQAQAGQPFLNDPPFTVGDVIYLSGCSAYSVPLYNETFAPAFEIQNGYFEVAKIFGGTSATDPVYKVDVRATDGGPPARSRILTPDQGGSNVVAAEANTSGGTQSIPSWFSYQNSTSHPTGAAGGTMYNVNPDAKVRIASLGEDIEQEYVVTSIDVNNEESEASESIKVENNLYVPGSFNKVGWASSVGATRYRIYKKISGLYGFIGETDEVTFKDDNIGPDLAVAPPIADNSMRKTAAVTLSDDGNYVTWVDHGMLDGTPVLFRTSDELPGLNENQTYYVINAAKDTFQVALTDESQDPVDITGTDTGVHTAVSGAFPGATSYYEGRRIFGGSKMLPQDVFMSASGTEADMSYSIPTIDSDRIYFRIAAREQSRVRHIIPLAQLMLLSDSTEYQVTPANDDILTPSSVSVRPQSFVGANFAPPALVNNTVVFSASRGGHVREMGYNASVLGYMTGDLSIRASHLFDSNTIKDMAYQKSPLPIVWCVSSSGKLLGLTYVPEEKVGAWHQHTTTDGTFESVVSVPEGDEDVVYVIVKRGSNRYVERLDDTYRGGTESISDAYFVDSGVTYTGAATTTIKGLNHLEGKSVAYLADGLPGTGTVSSGVLTLSKAAAKVHVGLPMTSQIKTLPMTMLGVDAFGTGRTKNITRVWARLFESAAFEAGPTTSNMRSSLTPAAGSLLSDFVEVTLPSSWNDEGQIVIQQSNPLPLTIAGLTIEVASGG